MAAGTEVGAAAARISAIVAREPGACWKPRDEPRIVAARQQRSRAGSGNLRNECAGALLPAECPELLLDRSPFGVGLG